MKTDGRLRCCLLRWQFFLDTCRLAATVPEVVQLGTAHVTAALDFDAGDQRGVGLERTFHAFAAGDLAHDKAAVQATVTLGDNHAFVSLHALACTFNHVHAHDDGVTRGEFGDCFSETGDFFLLERLNDVAHGFLRDLARAGTGIGANIKLGSWPMPPLFQLVSELSTLDTDELYRTLNMGVGMVVIVAPEHVNAVQDSIDETTWIIGELTSDHNKVLLK